LFALECMKNRTALVATSVGGLLDVVEPERTGMLVPPRQPKPLAEAIASLLVDPQRRSRLADAAADKLELYSIDAIVARFTDLYETLIARAAAA
jgi:glycosyltransferase involved in cell wall biosynthesis